MTINLTIGSTGKRSRFDPIATEVDFEALPDNSRAFVIEYGLKQWLSDATAGETERAAAESAINARLEKLRSGDFTRSRGDSGPSDDEGVVARKLATDDIREALKTANQKADKEAVKEAARLHFEANEKAYRTAARKEIAARKERAANVTSSMGADILKGLGLAPKAAE